MVKDIEKWPVILEEEKIDFKFKKSGFNRLVIFDLDETLIHTKREEDELTTEELKDLYGEDF